MNPADQEEQRRIFEARARLKEGFTTPEGVAELMRKVAAKRGQPAADQLLQDMREQWRRRREWMETTGPPI